MSLFIVLTIVLGLCHQVFCQSDLSTCPTRIQTLKHVRVYTDACLLFVEHELSWDDARKSCRSLGGDLITVKDTSKEKFILDSLRLEHWNAANVWIGATDRAKEGDWRWIDGSHVAYGHFAKGQGNNHNTGFFFAGGSNEDCALIRRSDGGLWHDYPCHPIVGNVGYHYTYACEFHRTTMAPTTITMAPITTTMAPTTTTMATTSTTIETMAPSTANPNIETPAPTTYNPNVETPAPTTYNPNLETPVPTTYNPNIETPAPTTSMPNVETPAPTTSMPNVETPAPTTMANIETPAPTTLPNVETPAATMPNIETPLPTAANNIIVGNNTVIIGKKRKL